MLSKEELSKLLSTLLLKFVDNPNAEFEIEGVCIDPITQGMFDILGIDVVENFGTKFIVKSRIN